MLELFNSPMVLRLLFSTLNSEFPTFSRIVNITLYTFLSLRPSAYGHESLHSAFSDFIHFHVIKSQIEAIYICDII